MDLLAPVGNWNMLRAAVQAGCNSIYLGIKGINMRAGAANFALNEMEEVINYCHQNKVKVYCTVNVIVFEKELEKVAEILKTLKKANVDAIICWDFSVISLCNKLEIPIHISTQASISNYAALKTLKEKFPLVENVVLARECSLEDIKEIKEKINLENLGVKVETFIHGARCISLSGRCFMSQELFNKSANRGECLQPCRREWKVIDQEEGHEMVMENNFIMSAKDLCALPFLPKLIEAGIDCFKIEGRNRGAAYVSKVVLVYKRAFQAIKENNYSEELINQLTEELKEVYNKGFSTGFYVDYPYHERCKLYGSKATTKKIQIGKVSNFYGKIQVVEFKVESEGFKVGDKIAFAGPTTGYYEQMVEEIHDDSGKIEGANKGDIVSVKLNSLVRENDKVYLVRKRE